MSSVDPREVDALLASLNAERALLDTIDLLYRERTEWNPGNKVEVMRLINTLVDKRDAYIATLKQL